MNIKISNDNPTQHVLIAIMNFCLTPDAKENNKYGYAYFELDDRPVIQINRFLDYWQNGKRDFEEVVVYLNDFFLIDEEYILDQNEDNPYYKGIRWDSINFLKERPAFDPSLSREAIGFVMVNPKDFYIAGEITHSCRSRYPLIIYKSGMVTYWMINHLLKRINPI